MFSFSSAFRTGLAALLFSLFALTASADSPWIYGIHWYGDPNSNDVEQMTGGKGVWDLETVMMYESSWSWSAQQSKFQTVVNKGHTVVIRVQPRWGWAIPAAAERAQYLNDLENLARSAAGICHIWQIGNEMNLYCEYNNSVLTAAEYIGFYKQCVQRIHNVSSPLGPQRVLVGGVSPGAYIGEVRHTDGLVYLSQMCDNMTASDCDGFAVHAYASPAYDANNSVNDFHNGYASQLSVIDQKGYAGKPAYILEWNRQTNPITDGYQEQQSATFLGLAYRDLQTWNSNAANHPIVCACWFIYPDMGGWEIFSIRKLRDYNSRGVNNDLWDTFQSACSWNIPAGTQTPTPPNPVSVVDNPQATVTGTWSSGSSATDKYGADYRYKYAGGGAGYVDFKPTGVSGSTKVYAWWPQGSNRTTAAEYKIVHQNGTSIVTQNQQTNGGKWNLLGTFVLNSNSYGRLTDNFPAGTVVMADAMKFEQVGPTAPKNLQGFASGPTTVNLGWTDVATNESNYVVARATAPGGPYTDIATLGANVTSYQSTGLTPNTCYYFVVRAANANGQSANSNELGALTWAADVIVDNANAGAFAASANWGTGTSATDKYGADYRYHATGPVTDSGTWTFTVTQTRNYEVYAWWCAGTNRASSAPYVVTHATGSATVARNQKVNGGSWQSLGTFQLNAGSNNVKISCWTTTGAVVIGDAIKVSAR